MPNSKSPAPMSVEEAVKYLQSKDLFGRIYDAIQTVIAAYEESRPLAQAALTWYKALEEENGDGNEDLCLGLAIAKHKRQLKHRTLNMAMEACRNADAFLSHKIPSDSHLLDTGDEDCADDMADVVAYLSKALKDVRKTQRRNADGWPTSVSMSVVDAERIVAALTTLSSPVPSTGDEEMVTSDSGCYHKAKLSNGAVPLCYGKNHRPVRPVQRVSIPVPDTEKVKTEPLDELLSSYDDLIRNGDEEDDRYTVQERIHRHVAALVQAETDRCRKILQDCRLFIPGISNE